MKKSIQNSLRQRIVLRAFVVCLVLLAYSAYTVVAGKVNLSVDELEKSMKSDLPLGTSKMRVEQWSKKNKFDFGPVVFGSVKNKTANEFSNSHPQHYDLSGSLYNSRSGLYGTCTIHVNFAFDKNGKLVRSSVNERCVSL